MSFKITLMKYLYCNIRYCICCIYLPSHKHQNHVVVVVVVVVVIIIIIIIIIIIHYRLIFNLKIKFILKRVQCMPPYSPFSLETAPYCFFIYYYIFLHCQLYMQCSQSLTLVVSPWSLPTHCQSIDVTYGHPSGSLANILPIGCNLQCQWARV